MEVIKYVLRTSIDKIKENSFKLTKEISRRYPAKTITDADYADDIALLANALVQAETLLHSLEWATAGIGLYVNAHKTEYMCFTRTGKISTINGSSLKLVDKFTYLGSSVLSTETDIDTWLAKAWTAIDRLSVIRKSDLTNKMKGSFFQAVIVSKLDKPDMRDTAREVGLISDVPLWTSSHGWAKAGQTAWTYIQRLCANTGCSPEDLPEAMDDREGWRERVRNIHADSRTWWWWWHLI